jgi:methylase of polypeptide subunit release factors
LLGRKNFGEVLELGASGGAWTWGLAHDDRVRRLYATETSPAALRIWPRSPPTAPP